MSTDDLKLSFLKNGIEQIAILVEDLDKAVQTYWELLGVGPWTFYTYGKPLIKRASYRGQPADPAQRIALAARRSRSRPVSPGRARRQSIEAQP